MSGTIMISKQKCLSLTSLTVSGKRCCSSYTTAREKERRIPKLGAMEILHKPQVPQVCKVKLTNNFPKTQENQSFASNDDSVVKNTEFRKNAVNIQMLSKSLHSQIFGDEQKLKQVNSAVIHQAIQKLKEHGLMKDCNNSLDDVSLKLPALRGKNIEEHFWTIGEEQCKPYRELVNFFIKNGIPNPPSEWLSQKGWTKYVEGKEPVSVPFPEDDIFVFDVEVCMKLGDLPTLATAVSSTAWYGWVCPDLAEGIEPMPKNWYNTNSLIPFEGKSVSKEKPRVIVGHNVSFDRAKIKEQYYLKNSALRFVDTMALHISVGGLNKAQKTKLASKAADLEEDIGKELCLCSLKELYSLYCDKELAKEERNMFVEGSLLDIKKNFQSLMKYCSKDVIATYEVLQAVFPIFLNRFTHPVTLAGMLEMGTAFLPVNQNWNKFLLEADQTYEDLKAEVSSVLSKKCDNACKLFHSEDYKNDLWLWDENWTTQKLKLTKKKLKKKPALNKINQNEEATASQQKQLEEEMDEEEKELQAKYQYLYDLKEILPKKLPFLPGYPEWYRKLCEKPDSPDWTPSPQLTTSMTIAPKLLKLTWENFPLHHTKEYGWGILIPDLFTENVETCVPFEKFKELTMENCKIKQEYLMKEIKKGLKTKKKNKCEFPTFYYNGSAIKTDLIIENCCLFFKMPHVNGENKNVGSPLSKEISYVFTSGVLGSSDSTAKKVVDLNAKITYWRNSRQRITSQMVVWLNKKEAGTVNGSDEGSQIGIIIPKVVVCGTLTRRAMESTWLTASKVTQTRIGSELRAMVQAPPGYHFIGADVDSQELWIASLIGDSNYAKVHGSTPLGWMTLSGSKASGTDMHSITAKAVGISRDDAKIINYARIYGASVRFAEKLLKQFNPSMSNEEARSKAVRMYRLTKGVKEFRVKSAVLEKFSSKFGPKYNADLSTAASLSKLWGKRIDDVFEKARWINGTESAMFNRLEEIATSPKPRTPFLKCRLSRVLEPRFEGDDLHLRTRINWVVQSGAVDFLHLMLVCMRWLTNGKARYCFSFHDEVRYMIPTEERYSGALALHITNLLVRSFCSHSLGINDLPQSVAFFSAVEVDKTLRKEANDDCITASNPQGIEKEYGIGPGETLNIYETIEKSGGSLAAFGTAKKRASGSNISSGKTETITTEMSQATKRKHVHREVLQGELLPPKENEQIVKVLCSKGSNLHEVETAESETFLASMPSKFRKNVWIKRGDYVLVENIEEGGKVKAEIVNILTTDYIKFLKKENLWPSTFSKNKDKVETTSNTNDDLFENNNRTPDLWK